MARVPHLGGIAKLFGTGTRAPLATRQEPDPAADSGLLRSSPVPQVNGAPARRRVLGHV